MKTFLFAFGLSLSFLPHVSAQAIQCKENVAPDDCRDVDFVTPATKTETRTGCFYSKATKRKVMYSVTFPKGYRMGGQCEKPYPYVIFLHGRDNDHRHFVNAGGEREMARVLSEKGRPPFLVVAPAQPEHSYWKDGTARGKKFGTATMVSEDLIEHVESKSCVAKERCLTGISMGGHGTMYLKMRNPEVFKNAYAIAPVFRSEKGLHECDRTAYGSGDDFNRQNPVALLKAKVRRSGRAACCQLRAEIAADDPFVLDRNGPETGAAMKEMAELCPGKFQVAGKGGHANDFFTPALGRALRFCADAFAGKVQDEDCDPVEAASSGSGALQPAVR